MKKGLKIDLFSTLGADTQLPSYPSMLRTSMDQVLQDKYLMRSFKVISLAIAASHVTIGIWETREATRGATRVSEHQAQLCARLCKGHWDHHPWEGWGRRTNQLLPHLVTFVPPEESRPCLQCTTVCWKGTFTSCWANWCPCRGSTGFPAAQSSIRHRSTPQHRCLRSPWAKGTRQLPSAALGSSNAGWHHSCPHGSHPHSHFWTSPQPQRLSHRH